MKQIVLFTFIALFFASCGNKGEVLAEEFCKCLDHKSVLGCKDLMSSHLEKLDESESSKYIQKTSGCIQSKGYQ